VELLGPILEMFVSESILHEPIENGSKNGLNNKDLSKGSQRIPSSKL